MGPATRNASGQSVTQTRRVKHTRWTPAAGHVERAERVAAARRKDANRRFSLPAARAKLMATDVAMRVTTDAVQVLGGAGYTTDFPVERYMREAKMLQIVEGTNQIQRVVIGRALARG